MSSPGADEAHRTRPFRGTAVHTVRPSSKLGHGDMGKPRVRPRLLLVKPHPMQLECSVSQDQSEPAGTKLCVTTQFKASLGGRLQREKNKEGRGEYKMSPFCVLSIFTSFHTTLAKSCRFTKEENRFIQCSACGICKKSRAVVRA